MNSNTKNSFALLTVCLMTALTGACGGSPEAEDELVGVANPIVTSRTFYFENDTVGSGWGRLTETAPASTSTMSTGWTVGNEAAGQFAHMDVGVERPESAFDFSLSYGSPNVDGLQNCFRSEDSYNNFTSGQAISMEMEVIAVSSGGSQDGRMEVRLFRCSDDTCSAGAEEIGAGFVTSSVTNLSTSTPQVVTGGAYEQATFHSGFYLVCLAWEITGAGSNNSKDVRLRRDANDSWITIPFVQ